MSVGYEFFIIRIFGVLVKIIYSMYMYNIKNIWKVINVIILIKRLYENYGMWFFEFVDDIRY